MTSSVYGEKVLVTVLCSRTRPLIRYEMSDSVMPASSPRCACGRPFDLICTIETTGVRSRVGEASRQHASGL
jgi:phenylacetate-CoA ligase